MSDRAAALANEPLDSAERRRLCRLLVGAALAIPGLTLAACGNPRPDWEPNWRRGKRGGGSHGNRGGGPGGGGGRP